MDRNTVIGIVLITLIMVVWLYMMPQPEVEPPRDAPADPPPAAVTEPDVLQPPAQTAQPLPVVTDSLLSGATEGEARTFTVTTDLYEATLSTKGATFTSFVLDKYTDFDKTTPVQLIDTTAAVEGALSLVFTTPSNHVVDTRSLYFDLEVLADAFVLGEDDEALEVPFVATLGGGQLRLTYVFQPGTYEVGLRVEQQNEAAFATADGYELVWTGGVPFAEKNRELEAIDAGAYARSGGEIAKVSLNKETYEDLTITGNVDWIAVKNKYFTAVVLPDGEAQGAELEGETYPTRPVPGNEEVLIVPQEHFTARLLMPPVGAEADTYRMYLGPMEFYRISDYGQSLYGMVDYGFGSTVTRPIAEVVIIPTFHFLSRFISNYGLVIILFAFLIKLVLYPLTKKSYESMARMQDLQPKMQAIKEKYGDNMEKQQQAMMKLYKESGVNPLGGCLPNLLQLPIIYALWRFFPNSILIRQEQFLWANDLSAPDVILQLPFTVPLLGDHIAGFTILLGVSMFLTMKLQTTSSSGAVNPQMKVMQWVFPIMLPVIFNRFAAGLSLYYLAYNLFTAAQQWWIKKQIAKKKENGSFEKKTGRNGQAAVNGVAKRRSAKSKR